MNYSDFLARKAITHVATGIADPPALSEKFFPFQDQITRWALTKGRAAIFAGCGLGKSWMALEWARVVMLHTKKPVLILTPLAVAQQFVREGEKLGIRVSDARAPEAQREYWAPGIWVANYESMHKLTAMIPQLGGVVLDECFARGTLVDTPSGQRAIETLRVGDKIVNAVGVDTIGDVHRREVEFCVRVKANGISCVCSPNHPFFTQRGWVGAQDLRAGDHILETAAALRLVRDGVLPSLPESESSEVLRSVLLSEMADDTAGDTGKGSLPGSSGETWPFQVSLAPVWIAESSEGTATDPRIEPDERSCRKGEIESHIESHGARTFRAWGQRARFDAASADHAGCTWTELGGGVCLVVGPTEGGLSNALQARLSFAREENRNRGGWQLSPQPQASGRKERCDAGFVGVDCVEILEPGHPDVERLRSPNGKLYLYDLGAARHPSYSVNGWLVHNSSILKAFDGKTRTSLIEAFHDTPFRLACTATPSPNDVTELGNHAEFLGAMSRVEMLATFFKHDMANGEWRLKGHAEKEFWAWVRTWAVCLSKPSDMGYSDDGYELPPLRMHEHVIDVDQRMARDAGLLFAFEATTLTEQRAVKKSTLAERVGLAAKLVNETPGQWLVFCDLNPESAALTKAIDGAVEVTGSDSVEHKESSIIGFADGHIQRLVSKSSIIGWGVNLQRAHQMVFVGADHSYEKFHQAVRREWRFGQKSPVDVHLVRTSADGRVAHNLERKRLEHEEMVREMVKAVDNEAGKRKRIDHVDGVSEQGRGWEMRQGDCVELVRGMADETVGFSVYSPPFASLYTYSDSDRDMGNCKDHDEFFEHYTFLLDELLRVTKPGRLSSVHCMIMPTSKVRDGVIGLTDFPGRIIAAHEKAGWIYHADVVVWKDPVTAMQRTKALGLLHKQIKKDSCMSRMGLPDRVVTFRKPGVNADPVTHRSPRMVPMPSVPDEQGLVQIQPLEFEPSNGAEVFGVDLWQKWASPVWDDINPSDTLQYMSAREEKDDRHICPLQLEVIRRCLRLWSNPGDMVLSPFAGIASEGHVSIQEGRRFIGCELKPSYFRQGCANLRAAESTTGDLFASLAR